MSFPELIIEPRLHFEAQTKLFNKVQDCLNQQFGLEVEWNCNLCRGKHRRNLLQNIKNARAEHSLADCRPDIALFDELGIVRTVLEIVVPHPPTKEVICYYEQAGIQLIKFIFKNTEDLKNLDTDTIKGTIDHCCLNPKCIICDSHLGKATMQVIKTDCWRCNKPMKMALVLTSITFLGPENFTLEQIALARSKGVILKSQFSKTSETTYMANTCPSCDTFIGEFFIHEYLCFDDAENYDAGFHCSELHDVKF